MKTIRSFLIAHWQRKWIHAILPIQLAPARFPLDGLQRVCVVGATRSILSCCLYGGTQEIWQISLGMTLMQSDRSNMQVSTSGMTQGCNGKHPKNSGSSKQVSGRSQRFKAVPAKPGPQTHSPSRLT